MVKQLQQPDGGRWLGWGWTGAEGQGRCVDTLRRLVPLRGLGKQGLDPGGDDLGAIGMPGDSSRMPPASAQAMAIFRSLAQKRYRERTNRALAHPRLAQPQAARWFLLQAMVSNFDLLSRIVGTPRRAARTLRNGRRCCMRCWGIGLAPPDVFPPESAAGPP